MLFLLFRFLKGTHTLTRRRSAALMRLWHSLSGCIRRDGRPLALGWGWRSWDVICQVRKCTWHHRSITDDISEMVKDRHHARQHFRAEFKYWAFSVSHVAEKATWLFRCPSPLFLFLLCHAECYTCRSMMNSGMDRCPLPPGPAAAHKEKPGGCRRQPVALTLCPHRY